MKLLKLDFVNVYESGALIEYEEFEKLPEEQKDSYVIADDFYDCDYIKVNDKTAIQFIKDDDKIFYILNEEFGLYEDTLKWIIDKFFRDNYKTAFYEVDTSDNSYNNIDFKIYQENLKKGIILFYRGGSGYTYGVHILEPLNYMDSLDILYFKQNYRYSHEVDKPDYPTQSIHYIKKDANGYLFEMVEP